MILAQAIVAKLWEEGCLKGSDDKWHSESLDEYQARLIDIVLETIHASQGPNKAKDLLKRDISDDAIAKPGALTIRIPKLPSGRRIRLPDPIT